MNRLYYGDNLEVLRASVASESVDLVYLDPPFNSNRGYNVIFARQDIAVADAQIQAFDDTWRWTPVTETQYGEYISGGLPSATADALVAFRTLLGENDAMAYLTNMAPRLVELQRVLKPKGTIYLHCDPTMSHYLKVLLDATFGARQFLNEIIWHYESASGAPKWTLHRNHDVIFRYAATAPNNVTWNHPLKPWPATTLAKWQTDEHGTYHMNGGKKYYVNPGGKLDDDVWDLTFSTRSKERLGYPTQKPVALLDKIITASTNPGDVVLDPFCGCGTSVAAAQTLGREWMGIDVTYLAIDLIEKRLIGTYGDAVVGTYQVSGIPKDKAAALALFSKDPFEFERWAVALLNAQPHARQKQQSDKGIDGVARFPLGGKAHGFGQILVSVKGGQTVNPSMVRDLGGTVSTRKADMGVLITNSSPTRGMIEEANHAGTYTYPVNGQVYPRIQMITVSELLTGKRPQLPGTLNPYMQAQRSKVGADQGELFE